jgi:hypothetical protein
MILQVFAHFWEPELIMEEYIVERLIFCQLFIDFSEQIIDKES